MRVACAWVSTRRLLRFFHVGVNVAARRAPALATPLRDLVAAEAFLLLAVEILGGAELGLARGLQVDLPHRIVGSQPRDMERAALAVIVAAEFGIILRALEIGLHVGIGPAGVAERSPVIVIAPVAADIDHRIDRGRASQPLAARLIADAPVEAGLRHRLERPVVDLARDHQDHGPRGGHHPIVVGAAGLQQRHRRPGVLRETAGDRAAAGTAADHHKIKRIRHGRPPAFYAPRLGFCALSGKSGPKERSGASIWHVMAVIKSPKDRSRAFPKPLGVGTYRSHPRAFARVAFSGSLRTRLIGALGRGPDSFQARFFRRRATVYRGVEQPGSSSGS